MNIPQPGSAEKQEKTVCRKLTAEFGGMNEKRGVRGVNAALKNWKGCSAGGAARNRRGNEMKVILHDLISPYDELIASKCGRAAFCLR